MLRVKNFFYRFSQTNIFLESCPKILGQSVNMQCFNESEKIGVLKTVTYCCWLLFGLASNKKKLPSLLLYLPLRKLKQTFFESLAGEK